MQRSALLVLRTFARLAHVRRAAWAARGRCSRWTPAHGEGRAQPLPASMHSSLGHGINRAAAEDLPSSHAYIAMRASGGPAYLGLLHPALPATAHQHRQERLTRWRAPARVHAPSSSAYLICSKNSARVTCTRAPVPGGVSASDWLLFTHVHRTRAMRASASNRRGSWPDTNNRLVSVEPPCFVVGSAASDLMM